MKKDQSNPDKYTLSCKEGRDVGSSCTGRVSKQCAVPLRKRGPREGAGKRASDETLARVCMEERARDWCDAHLMDIRWVTASQRLL